MHPSGACDLGESMGQPPLEKRGFRKEQATPAKSLRNSSPFRGLRVSLVIPELIPCLPESTCRRYYRARPLETHATAAQEVSSTVRSRQLHLESHRPRRFIGPGPVSQAQCLSHAHLD